MNMKPLPLGITAEKDEDRQISPEDLINLYPVTTQKGKQPIALKQTPGLAFYSTVGTEHRGAFIVDGIRYVVSGTSLYKESPLGTFSSLGTIPGSGRVGMAANDRDAGPQLIVVNGTTTGYVYSVADGFSSTTLTYASHTVAYQDGYFIFDATGTGKWFISSVNDGTTYDSTEVGATNSRPDNVLAVISKKQQIWVPGTDSIEIFINTGAADFPFTKIQEVTIDDVGLGNRDTLVYGDNALYFIGSDKLPYRTNGYNLEIIGNSNICQVLEDVEFDDLTAFGFKWRSHYFYQINLPDGTAYRFDAKTNLWHTVRGWASGYAPYRGGHYHYFDGQHYVGDYENGNIYTLSKDALKDSGAVIRREMITPFIHNNGNQFSVNRIRADFKHGAGNTSAEDPVCMLEWSNDGENWSTPVPGFIGMKGKNTTQIWWNSLGCHYQIAYKIWWTDSIDTELVGLYGG
jgi:hypothetical protein